MTTDLARAIGALRTHSWLALIVTPGCAAQPVAAKAPPDTTHEPAPIASEPEATEAPAPTPAPAPEPAITALPDQCADENADGICGPPDSFVRDVCGGFAKPDIALLLFAKDSPWTRGYLRLNVDGWYAGSRSARVELKFNEEVIVLHHPNPRPGAIIVNGGGAPFEVMRLDGHCATLSSEEITLKRPPAPKHPVVPWRQLDPLTRDALRSDPAIAAASSKYEDGCTEPTPGCTTAGAKLTTAILEFMARRGKLPAIASRR